MKRRNLFGLVTGLLFTPAVVQSRTLMPVHGFKRGTLSIIACGYKGRVDGEAGLYYAPYIPVFVKKDWVSLQ